MQADIHRNYIFLFILLLAGTFARAQDGLIRDGKLWVHYQIHGKGKPLVLIHAGYQDMRMWDQQVAYFKKYNTVITIDLPGHGLTKGVDTTLLIQDVLRVCLDSLHIKTASFAGLSLGASSVEDFVLAYPERVDKVILVSPGLSGCLEVLKMDAVSKACFDRLAKADSSDNKDSVALCFRNVWCVGPGRKPLEVCLAARNYVFETTMSNLQQHTEDNRWPQFAKPPAALRIQQWRRPLLLITGDQDVPLIINIAAWMHKNIKNSMTVVFPQTAHMLNLEKPVLFNQTVHSFLESAYIN